MTEPGAGTGLRRTLPAIAILALAYVLLVGTALALQWNRTAAESDHTWPSESYDEVRYHRPVIERFAEELPAPNLRDYDSATTPGYHLLAAVLHRMGGPDAVRLFFAAVALLLPLLLFRAVAPRVGASQALLLCGLLCLCNYFIAAAVWITTDNFALLFVTAALIGMIAAVDRGDWRLLLVASLAVVAAVLVRQIHLWLCGPLFIAALLFAPRDLRGLLAGVLGCAVAVLTVGAFVLHWGGLTPPGFTVQHSGWNFTALAYVLALFGALSIFFMGYLTLAREDWATIAVGGAAGLLMALLLVTEPSMEAGRWGGVLWQLAMRLPVIAERSLVFLLLCPIGGAAVMLWLKRTWPSFGGLLVLALVAFAVAHTANFQIWQRYYEPFLLVVLILLASRSDTRREWAPLPIAVLAAGLAGLTVVKIYLPLLR